MTCGLASEQRNC